MPKRRPTNSVIQIQNLHDIRLTDDANLVLSAEFVESTPFGLTPILYDIVLQKPVNLPGAGSQVLHAFSVHQIARLCSILLSQPIKPANISKRMRAMRVYPCVPAFSTDSRNRFYVDGAQTQCYVLSREFPDTASMLAYIHELNVVCPALANPGQVAKRLARASVAPTRAEIRAERLALIAANRQRGGLKPGRKAKTMTEAQRYRQQKREEYVSNKLSKGGK